MPGLKDYRKKRDFNKTPEPSGEKKSAKKVNRHNPVFIINKHDASNLHYDLRIEINNKLKSWSVPKGPSIDPSEKRLAIQTEDHPLEYADFEGIIPKGNYGAGAVIIWDKGIYRNVQENTTMKESFKKGKIEIDLEGKKLKGKYALIRTGNKKHDKGWIFLKMKDRYADARRNPVSTEPKSVVSGKTIEEIKKSH
jgi:DNA ligase D-like protein (predicted 3'-phosphoesterase)